MVKRGDTLIEVTIAIGIFSLVAIAVVGVVNSSTSGAQTALETTLTREEIDTQAEALRFIQSSYINSNTANKETTDNDEDISYKLIWQAIADRAQSPTGNNYSFVPKSCNELYDKDNGEINKKAFVINTRQLGNTVSTEDETKPIVITPENNKTVFNPASTYPRIIYGTANNNTDTGAVLNDTFNANIYHVEGLYVIAVKGPTTFVFSKDLGQFEGKKAVTRESAYYDFYIRSCWYESGANIPTTISTVIRLYNPNVVQVDAPNPITP